MLKMSYILLPPQCDTHACRVDRALYMRQVAVSALNAL